MPWVTGVPSAEVEAALAFVSSLLFVVSVAEVGFGPRAAAVAALAATLLDYVAFVVGSADESAIFTFEIFRFFFAKGEMDNSQKS